MTICEHRHTHPFTCDDCGAPWCGVCATYHERRDAFECGRRLRSEITRLVRREHAGERTSDRPAWLTPAVVEAVERWRSSTPFARRLYRETHGGACGDGAVAVHELLAALEPAESTEAKP